MSSGSTGDQALKQQFLVFVCLFSSIVNEDKDFQGLHAVHLHQAIHTFEIPEVFSLPVGQGDVQYLKWIEDGMEED